MLLWLLFGPYARIAKPFPLLWNQYKVTSCQHIGSRDCRCCLYSQLFHFHHFKQDSFCKKIFCVRKLRVSKTGAPLSFMPLNISSVWRVQHPYPMPAPQTCPQFFLREKPHRDLLQKSIGRIKQAQVLHAHPIPHPVPDR